MSIYRAILEEDLELGGVLDDDNCVELKEIEGVVADHDANEFEQSEAQDAEFGTSYGDEIGDAEDILDESFMAIAEAQMDYNKLMMAIGIHEVNEAAAGREILYESVDIKGYIKRAKDWVVAFFKKVWQVLQRFAANISSTFRTNKGFADKYAKQIRDGESLYRKNGKKMKMYEYTNLDSVMSKEAWTDGINNAAGLSNLMAAAKDWENAGLERFAVESQEEIVRNFRKLICGTACDAGEFRSKLHDHVCGGSEKKEGYMSADAIIKILGDGKAIKECRKAMDKAKKEYKDTIKKLNDLERKFTRDSRKDGDGAEAAKNSMTVVIRLTNVFKEVLTATQVSRATILSAARSRMSQARMFGQAYVYAANKGNEKYKGFQKESAEYGFLSNLDLV